MEIYEVVQGIITVLDSLADTIFMKLPLATVCESRTLYNSIEIQLKDGSKYMIQVVRIKDNVRV